MPHASPQRAFFGALLIGSLGLSAHAQTLSGKAAWEDLRERIVDLDMTIQTRSLTDFGTAMEATGVRIATQDMTDGMVLELPLLRVEGREGSRVAVLPGDAATLTLMSDGTERVFAVSPEGMLSYYLTDDVIDYELSFSRIAIDMIRASRRGVALSDDLNAVLTALTGSIHLEREGEVEIAIDIGEIAYDFSLPTTPGSDARQTADARVADLHLEVSASEVDLLIDGMEAESPTALSDAFAGGFHAHMLLTAGQNSGLSTQDMGGMPLAIASEAVSGEMRVDLADGEVSVAIGSGAGRFRGGSGPMQGDLTFDELSFSAALPLIATPEDRPAHYALSFQGLTPSADTLAMVGAADFAGDSVSLALRVGADMRWLRDVGPGIEDGDEPPLDISEVRLEDLNLSVGDARFTGNGAFVFLGGLLASLSNDVPEGTGDFVFELIGGDALLTRLTTMGLIPQDQQFFARMMMNGLGRPVGEDHLRSEVAIRPGGVITVNGAALPF